MSEDRSGRILLRLPRSLHGMLAEAAEREGVSLNQFALGVLAGSVGWRQPAPPASEIAQRVGATIAHAHGDRLGSTEP